MIKKYKRKSEFVEAVQWTGENKEEIERFIGKECKVDSDGVLMPKEIKGFIYACSPNTMLSRRMMANLLLLTPKT